MDRYLSTLQSRYAWLTQRFQISTIVLIWVCSTGTASPWIIFTVYKEFDWLGGHEIICQAHFPSTRSRKVYYVTFFALCYAIPLAVMFSFVISTLVKSNNRTSDISGDIFNDAYIHHETKRKVTHKDDVIKSIHLNNIGTRLYIYEVHHENDTFMAMRKAGFF